MLETLKQAPSNVPAILIPASRAEVAVKVYGRGVSEVRALDGISIRIEAKRFSAIMGPSGSGKSTLLHCLAGLDRLTSGRVFLGETDLSTLSEKELTLLRRDRTGFVFQFFNLLPMLSAIENITLPLSLAGRKPDVEWLDRVIHALGLQDRLQHRPNEMSGGEQQRVAVARALLHVPMSYLLMSQPEILIQGLVARCWSCFGKWSKTSAKPS
jgi:putative ABC transport system ATP-binding protein